MDPIHNPFAPGAGSPPPELVGRAPLMEIVRILLERVKLRRAEKSLLMTGLRGVGKTVLLNSIQVLAQKSGYHTITLEAHENQALSHLLVPHLRRTLYEIDRLAGRGHKVKQGLAVLKSFISAVKLQIGEFSIGLDIEPQIGAADSGDVELDLPQVFVALGEAAQERHTAIALLIDEIHYFSQKELSALIMAMHKMQQRQLPVVLIGAGLPILPALAGESKTYAERLFHFPQIGPLTRDDAFAALQRPAQAAGVRFNQNALDEIYAWTLGYPYFLQEWAYQAWNQAAKSPITLAVVQGAQPMIQTRLDHNFFRVRFDRLTPTEKNYLRAMAQLSVGRSDKKRPNSTPIEVIYRTADVAAQLGLKSSALTPLRASLIAKGVIYSPAHGDIAFTVPLFDQFMRRIMPTFTHHA